MDEVIALTYFGRGWPVSEDARLTEDFRVVRRERTRQLEILQTLRDPVNYTEPLMRVSYAESARSRDP